MCSNISNFTLACLLFHFICASVPEFTNKNASSLSVDISSGVDVPKLEGFSTPVQSSSQRQSVPVVDEHTSEHFKALLDGGAYEELRELSDGMDDNVFLERICPVMATFEHFMGLFKLLRQLKGLSKFLVHGDMALVEQVTAELEFTKYHIHKEHILTALTLSLNEDRYERVIDLLKAVKERHAYVDVENVQEGRRTRFESFTTTFFDVFNPLNNSTSLKRFFTHHGEEFSKHHKNIFDTFCLSLVRYLFLRLTEPNAKKLLNDFVGQPLPLTSTALAKGFLFYYIQDYSNPVEFIDVAWREAIEEVLNRGSSMGERKVVENDSSHQSSKTILPILYAIKGHT